MDIDNIFSDFNDLKSPRTVVAYRHNLDVFCDYLATLKTENTPNGIIRTAEDLQANAESWATMTYGIVKGFRAWMLKRGYAIATLNVKLATVRKYARLAAEAEALDERESGLIQLVGGYTHREGKRIDERRDLSRRRRGNGTTQKSLATEISKAQAAMLKNQPDTPQGRRDAVLMSILLDHGLRAGELAMLRVGDFKLQDGTMKFYRAKVDKVQTHRLTPNTAAAVRAYIESGDAPDDPDALFLRGSRKGGKLSAPGMSAVNISKRVRALGKRMGIEPLSAHDCRHHWATQLSRDGISMADLRDAGGWESIAMAARYIRVRDAIDCNAYAVSKQPGT